MSPLGVVGAVFALGGGLSILAVLVWAVGRLLDWPPVVALGPLRAGPLLLMLGAGVLWIVTAVELGRGRKRGGILAIGGLALGIIQSLLKEGALVGSVVFGAVCLVLLAWGWRDLDSW